MFEAGRDTVGVAMYAEVLDVAVEVGVGPADAPGWAVWLFGCGGTVVVVSGAPTSP